VEKSREDILESIYQESITNDDNIISVLQELQKEFGYIEEKSVNWFSKRTHIPASRFYGVATFYSQFHLSPRGKNTITVCSGTVCHVKGAPKIISKLRDELKLQNGEETTKDMLFSLENVNCVGACSIAPVVTVNENVYGKQTPGKILKTLKSYKD
jgi:NADH:ubiquinone oxidoreductase subunit E